MEIGWKFPSANDAGNNGLKNGTEYFKDDVVLSLAKEICQNSLDARIDSTKPVTIEFNEFCINRNEFPGYDDFIEVINREIEFAKENYKKDNTTLNFYLNAKEILMKEKIVCLRISDFNTTGLTGSDIRTSSNWNNLVKNTGVSDKNSTDGGSFGIGKWAAFACSRIYTVFYSTISNDNLKAYQGVARLSSYADETGDITQGIGYYGNKEGLKNISNVILLDKSFSRDKTGTDLFIMAFDDRDVRWKIKIVASIIDNFMFSIYSNNLIIKIGDITLDKNNIMAISEKILEENKDLFNEYTSNYYEILMTNKHMVSKYYYTMFEENDVEFEIALDPSMKNRIAVVRNNGMKIFDKDHLPQIAYYSGILYLKGSKVNEYFRKMENPQHDGWSVKRHENPDEASLKYKELFEFVRTIIKSIVESNQPESMDAEGVGEYLPDELEIGNTDQEKVEGIVDEMTRDLETKASNVNSKKTEISKEEQFGDDTEDGVNSTENFETSTGQGNSNEETGGLGTPNTGNSNESGNLNINSENLITTLKNRCFYHDGGYNFIFISDYDVKDIILYVEIAGENNNKKAIIKEARKEKRTFGRNTLKVERNMIFIENIIKNEKNKIFFKIEEMEKWTLEVKIYANKK